MNLDNESIASWIYARFKNNYFLYDRISSIPKVIGFTQNENSLEVEYEFWDDGHANSDDQDFFIFDIDIANEYGLNYPKQLQLVKLKDKFTWSSKEKCENLTLDIIKEEHLDLEINAFEWGDKEIESLVDDYFPIDISSGEEVKLMLIESYRADELGLPKCIPLRLKKYFQSIIDYKF